MFIQVPILCTTPQSNALKDLGIESEDTYTVKTGKIRVESVEAYYPSSKPKSTIVHTSADCIEVVMTYEQFDKLIS